MARRRQTFEEWAHPSDAEQMQFCINYLRAKRKNIRTENMANAFADIGYVVSRDNNPSELFSHMRKAWNTWKCRKHQKGTQLFQLRLSHQAISAVKQQARNQAIEPSDLVQSLILDGHNTIQSAKEQTIKRLEASHDKKVIRQSEEIKRLKDQLQQKTGQFAMLQLRAEMSQLKTEVGNLQQISAALIEKFGSVATMPEACGVAESTNTIENNCNPAADNTGI